MHTSYTFQEKNIFLVFQLIISWPQAMPGSGITAIKLIIPFSSLLLPHVIAFIAMALFLNLGPDHAST